MQRNEWTDDRLELRLTHTHTYKGTLRMMIKDHEMLAKHFCLLSDTVKVKASPPFLFDVIRATNSSLSHLIRGCSLLLPASALSNFSFLFTKAFNNTHILAQSCDKDDDSSGLTTLLIEECGQKKTK